MPRPRCRVCGATTAKAYSKWATYKDREGFVGVHESQPESDRVCINCITNATRGTLKKPAAAETADDHGDDELTEDESLAEEEAAPPDDTARSKMGKRSASGCYVCGRTRSSRFHRWRLSKLALFLETIKPARPESPDICGSCYAKYLPYTALHEVRSSLYLSSNP